MLTDKKTNFVSKCEAWNAAVAEVDIFIWSYWSQCFDVQKNYNATQRLIDCTAGGTQFNKSPGRF